MRVRTGAVVVICLAAIGLCYSRVHAQTSHPQDTKRSVWDGVYTDAQADRGKKQFTQYCSDCHDDTVVIGDDIATPVAGGDFLSNWNGLTAGDLFERIRTTMPLNKPGSLARNVNCDILAYIFSFNKFPSGQTELPHDTPTLNQIRIQTFKPDQVSKGDRSGKGN
jgi:S-disulfanyl-L-cysteine oxidoreductase SoxD